MSWDPELYEARHDFVWRMGAGVVDLLAPRAGERILDLGCGTGQLTQKIADAGADVVGVDADANMIAQARQNFPGLRFLLQDASRLEFSNEFDAVFSNAALHWMLDPDAVVAGVARALRPGGRFVAEMGGKGNIEIIATAIKHVAARYRELPPFRNYYPSIAEYTAILERHGLEPRFAQIFDRPTPLEGENGMENWIKQFKNYYFEGLAPSALAETVAELRPKLHSENGWIADYRRLRFVAVKPQA